ncbi:WD40 repeat domain-containing protein [Pleurocapsales cyanobacterium LEGE 06147]|nr:WD40 repeat domain-containing protein [Pleurocapsales cyanobacterium LEGE 06147]
MEQWFNLLIQVAKPVLTTLAYTGTNVFLNTFHKEIREQQLEQTKLVFNALGVRENKIGKINRVIKDITSTIELDYREQLQQLPQKKIERSRFAGAAAPQLLLSQDELLLQLAQKARETTLKLPEINKSLDYWPLRLLPHQLLCSSPGNDPAPLKIIIASPQKIGKEFKSIGIESSEIEQILSQNLREFLSHNYSLHSKIKPTEFLGGAWNSQNFYGEASIRILFDVLQTKPTLILETEIESNFIIFRLAYWGTFQRKYCYETIFKLPYKNLIEESIKARALRWKVIHSKLLALGKSTEEIERLGGDNTINLALVEEVEKLQEAGIDTQELIFPYQVNRQDFEYICQFLSICQCLVAGWITDIHYLLDNDISPHLPQWLPKLGSTIAAPELLEAITRATVSLYQEVVKTLTDQRPQRIPILTLKLAQSLIELPDRSLVKKQIEYSFEIWLQQRQLPSLKEIEKLDIIDTIQDTFTTEDWQYLIDLKSCLSALNAELSMASLQKLVDSLSGRMPAAKVTCPPTGAHFSLDYTVTEIAGKIFSLSINSDSYQLVSESEQSILALWHLKRRKVQLSPTHQLKGHAGKIAIVTLCPSGKILASSDTTAKRSEIKIWNLQTGKLERSLFGHKQVIHSLVIYSAGDRPILASGSHKIKLWDLTTGESWLTLFGHKEWVYSLAISPDGQTLVSGSQDKSVRIWSLQTGELLRTLVGHQGAVRIVAIAPDGNTIASGSDDGTVKLWELKTGKLRRTLAKHSSGVSTLAIAPDAQYLFSGSQDGKINVWYLPTGELLQTLLGHQQSVRALAVHPNGSILASGSQDKTIKFWRIL